MNSNIFNIETIQTISSSWQEVTTMQLPDLKLFPNYITPF